MVNCIIIEDQLPAQRILKKYIKEFGNLNLIGTFTNVMAANESMKSHHIDLIFLDIHLPKISGIDFLKSLNKPPNVILCTAFSEFALESYELNVVDYLLKPFSYNRFSTAVTKAFAKIKNDKQVAINKNEELETNLYIKSGHEHHKIPIDSILFINSDSDYTDIYTINGKLTASESLKYWEETLKTHQFLRVHKSYVINSKMISKTTTRFIFMEGHKIPIGRTYKNDVLEKLKI